MHIFWQPVFFVLPLFTPLLITLENGGIETDAANVSSAKAREIAVEIVLEQK